jgi:hypothetical protein
MYEGTGRESYTISGKSYIDPLYENNNWKEAAAAGRDGKAESLWWLIDERQDDP